MLRCASTSLRRRYAVALGLAVVLVACGGEPTPDAEQGGPLTSLPACDPAPSPAADADVEGLIAPEGLVVTGVEPSGQIVQVTGYIAQTPVQVRRYYQETDGIEIFDIEDEVVEAEALVGDGSFRTFIKASAICDQGARVIAVVAPEIDASVLPEPTGSERDGERETGSETETGS